MCEYALTYRQAVGNQAKGLVGGNILCYSRCSSTTKSLRETKLLINSSSPIKVITIELN